MLKNIPRILFLILGAMVIVTTCGHVNSQEKAKEPTPAEANLAKLQELIKAENPHNNNWYLRTRARSEFEDTIGRRGLLEVLRLQLQRRLEGKKFKGVEILIPVWGRLERVAEQKRDYGLFFLIQKAEKFSRPGWNDEGERTADPKKGAGLQLESPAEPHEEMVKELLGLALREVERLLALEGQKK